MMESEKHKNDCHGWHDVPERVLPVWTKLFEESREGVDVNCGCPVCGARDLHRWYYRGEPVNVISRGRKYLARGAEWQWCSNCRSYAHYSALVPDWWTSSVEVPLSRLVHDPEPIEQEMRRLRKTS